MNSPNLLSRVKLLQSMLRQTQVVRLEAEGVNLYAKLDMQNPIGSLKDRPAFWILKSAIEQGRVGPGTTIVESSSGNFANALASYCRLLGLKFIPVIDPNITSAYEMNLRQSCETVVKVEQRDDTGGFLKTRLHKVQELLGEIPDSFWTNQYGNEDVVEAHYRLTGEEICGAFSQLDYIFVGVSTAGTIAGVSQRVKEKFPSVKVIAVDAEGSVIFGGPPKKRHIPGIGASVQPGLLKYAHIDDVVLVPEIETVRCCHELLNRHGIFAGGSSGSTYAAVKRYLHKVRGTHQPNVLFMCADKGTAYLDSVYSPEWARRLEQ